MTPTFLATPAIESSNGSSRSAGRSSSSCASFRSEWKCRSSSNSRYFGSSDFGVKPGKTPLPTTAPSAATKAALYLRVRPSSPREPSGGTRPSTGKWSPKTGRTLPQTAAVRPRVWATISSFIAATSRRKASFSHSSPSR